MDFNSHECAIKIEFAIRSVRPDLVHKADEIERNPIEFLDKTCLDILEIKSEESKIRVCEFWDKYEIYKGKHIREFGEDKARELVRDIRNLFRN